MNKYLKSFVAVAALVMSGYAGFAVGQGSHLDTSIASLKTAISEAIQCGGGGKDGAGCKGARGEAIVLMRQAMAKLQAAKAGQ